MSRTEIVTCDFCGKVIKHLEGHCGHESRIKKEKVPYYRLITVETPNALNFNNDLCSPECIAHYVQKYIEVKK